jgi:hypothetical protein
MPGEDDWFTSRERIVRYEPLFDEQVEQLGVQAQRLDDAIRGLEEALSRHPEIFPKVGGTPFSMARLLVYNDAPPLRVYFTYDATTVRVMCMDFCD